VTDHQSAPGAANVAPGAAGTIKADNAASALTTIEFGSPTRCTGSDEEL